MHSSPLGRQFGNQSDGDVHFWAVWWGSMKLEDYEFNIGLFNSEFGMQSFLPLTTMKLFLPENDLKYAGSLGISHHNAMRNGPT